MAPSSKPPSGPVAVAGPEAPPAILVPFTEVPGVEITGPKKTHEKPLLKKLGVINDTLPLSKETARQHLEAIVSWRTQSVSTTGKPEFSTSDVAIGQDAPVTSATTELPTPASATTVLSEQPVPVAPASPREAAPNANAAERPDTAPTETKPDQAAPPASEPAQAPADAAPARQEATAATTQHPVETEVQSQAINALLGDATKLLIELKDTRLLVTAFVREANGQNPIGAAIRQEVLQMLSDISKPENINSAKGLTLAAFKKHKAQVARLRDVADQINALNLPQPPEDPADNPALAFIQRHQGDLKNLPEGQSAEVYLEQLKTGRVQITESLPQILYGNPDFRIRFIQQVFANGRMPNITNPGSLVDSIATSWRDRNWDRKRLENTVKEVLSGETPRGIWDKSKTFLRENSLIIAILGVMMLSQEAGQSFAADSGGGGGGGHQ